MMGLFSLLKNYTDNETGKDELLDALLTSAHELDGIIRAIVKKTEQIES